MVPNLDDEVDTVVLTEGESDRGALLRLAELSGLDLELNGIAVIAMGGATNVGSHMDAYGPTGADLRLAGLCDAAELPYFTRAAIRCGLAVDERDESRSMEEIGFFTCHGDLEEELIRAIGVDEMLAFIDARGDLSRFRTFQNQPAQRERAIEHHLWRFIGTKAMRKVTWAPLMVEAAFDAERIPPPLERLIDSL